MLHELPGALHQYFRKLSVALNQYFRKLFVLNIIYNEVIAS